VWGVSGLADGQHEVKLEWTGSKNASSSLTVISLDAVDVTGVLTQSDVIAPVTTATVNSSYTTSASISLQATDTGGAGLAYTKWRLNSSSWTTGSVAATTAPGTYTLQYYSVDRYGNTEVSKSATFSVIARYEETDNRILKPGVWTLKQHASLSGGQWSVADTSSAYATIAFNGPEVRWISTYGSDQGIARVTLDNGTPVLVDLYSSKFQFQKTVWSASGLANTVHSLKIEWTGSKNASASDDFVGIDRIEAAGDLIQTDFAPPLFTSNLQPKYLSTSSVLLKPADSGSGVNWTRWKIDGSEWTTGTLISLPYVLGTHTLSYQAEDGAGNQTSVITTSYAMLKRYEQNIVDAYYTGTWVTKFDVGRTSNAWASSTTTGSAAALDFTGTRLDVIGSLGAGSGIAYFKLDDNATQTVDLYARSNLHQSTLWSTGQLVDGVHHIQITVSGTQNASATACEVPLDAYDVAGSLMLIDSVPPVTSSNVTTYYAGDTTINLSASDVRSAVASTAWSLDGGPVRSGSAAAVPFSPGIHTLSFRSTDIAGNVEDTKTVSFVMVTRVDETDPCVSYEGTWTTNAAGHRIGTTWTYTTSDTAAVNVHFSGQWITWVTSYAPSSGIARVSVDGGTPQLVNLYASGWNHKQIVWSSGALELGEHTLRIEMTGSKDSSSTDDMISTDAFDIAGTPLAP
jgi:hypothetical protein